VQTVKAEPEAAVADMEIPLAKTVAIAIGVQATALPEALEEVEGRAVTVALEEQEARSRL